MPTLSARAGGSSESVAVSESFLRPSPPCIRVSCFSSPSLIRVSPLSESFPYPSLSLIRVGAGRTSLFFLQNDAGASKWPVRPLQPLQPLRPLRPLQPSHARAAGRGDAARGAGDTETVT